jgi:hypothetical protein
MRTEREESHMWPAEFDFSVTGLQPTAAFYELFALKNNPKEIDKFPVSVVQEAVTRILFSLTEVVCARCVAFYFL